MFYDGLARTEAKLPVKPIGSDAASQASQVPNSLQTHICIPSAFYARHCMMIDCLSSFASHGPNMLHKLFCEWLCVLTMVVCSLVLK